MAAVAPVVDRSRADGGDAFERLEALARSRGPLRAALAALALRFVALRGWERLGFARVGDWARERAGISGREVQDLAHVADVLGRLRRLERALVTGELGWTKVRLLARVATPEDVGAWVALARRRTVHALEREVRALDRGALEAGGAACGWLDEERRETLRIPCTPAAHAKWWALQGLARRVAGQSLPAWECAESAAAETISALGIEPVAEATEAPSRAVANACADEDLAAEAVPRLFPIPPEASLAEARALVDGLHAADALELDRRLRRAVRLEQRLDARVGALLFAVSEGRMRGHAAGRLAERLGMSPRRARALVRLERAARLWPALGEAYRGGKLSWVQAHALAPLAFVEERPDTWIAFARRVSVRRLIEDVALGVMRAEVAAERQTRAKPRATETSQSVIHAPLPVARLVRATLCTVQRRLGGTAGDAWEAILDHARETWTALDPSQRPPEHFRVFERDGWRCTVPGCTSYRNLHAHHIEFRSAGGSDEESNLTTLCAWHHLRAVHAGIIRLAGRAPDGLRFEMPFGAYRSGDVLEQKSATS